MYRTKAYVGHFLVRFERNVKLYMACAALIGFSVFGIYSVLFNLYLLRMDYDARSASSALELKPSTSLTIEGSWSSVWEYLPGGSFDERKTIWRGRATYFATKRLFLRGFAQDAGYLDERDINLLASYEIAPKSRVYLAYNLGNTAAERAEKLRFKVAYLLSY